MAFCHVIPLDGLYTGGHTCASPHTCANLQTVPRHGDAVCRTQRNRVKGVMRNRTQGVMWPLHSVKGVMWGHSRSQLLRLHFDSDLSSDITQKCICPTFRGQGQSAHHRSPRASHCVPSAQTAKSRSPSAQIQSNSSAMMTLHRNTPKAYSHHRTSRTSAHHNLQSSPIQSVAPYGAPLASKSVPVTSQGAPLASKNVALASQGAPLASESVLVASQGVPLAPTARALVPHFGPRDFAILSLCFVACSISAAFSAVLMAAVPALLALRRAAIAIEQLAMTARQELPGTMAAVRLSGMEISDLTMELSDLSQEITEGVRTSTRPVHAEDGPRHIYSQPKLNDIHEHRSATHVEARKVTSRSSHTKTKPDGAPKAHHLGTQESFLGNVLRNVPFVGKKDGSKGSASRPNRVEFS